MKTLLFITAYLCLLATVSLAQQKLAPIQVQPLELGRPIERELKGGEIHSYTVALGKGQFLNVTADQRKIGLLVRVFAPNGDTLTTIDSPADQVSIPVEAKATGNYRIDVFPYEKEAKTSLYTIKLNEVLSAEAYGKRVAEDLRRQKAVISWLKANAIPLRTLEAGNSFVDLQPLKNVLKDVRFVGLGEGTHGTREFFQVKHRLLEFLVREMGYRVFALEGSYSDLQVINDYVMGRLDDVTKTLDEGAAGGNTEEVRAMLDWARTYNAGVSPDKRVTFIGFDMQGNKPGKARLLTYLKRTAPAQVAGMPDHRPDVARAFVARLDSVFAINGETLLSRAMTQQNTATGKASQDSLTRLKTPYNDLFAFLESNRASLIAKSSEAEWAQMHEYARMLVQFIDMALANDSQQGPAIRDRYMAENFTRLVNEQPVGTRVVVWAHNSHVATDSSGSFVPIGAYLRQTYGSAYYALGLVFNQGSFQASGTFDVQAKRVMRQFTVKSAPAGSVEGQLAQTGIDKFVVDFRSGDQTADVRSWLTTPQTTRASIGWYFPPTYEVYLFQRPATLGKLYDGLLFIDTTTRARPNPSVKSDLRGDK